MTCDKLKRYDLYMLLENGLLKAKMVEKEDGEYFEVNQVRKAFAEHKEECEQKNLRFYNEWKDMFEKFSPNKAELDALRKENAYLRRLALHALMGWAMGMSLVNYLDKRGSRKKQIAYFMVSQKFNNLHKIEKDKWRAGK